MRELAGWAGFEVPCITPYNDRVHEALIRGLFASNAWMALYMITDLFATAQRFNVPGAVSASNWSQRLVHPIAEWNRERTLVAKMERVRDILRATGRI